MALFQPSLLFVLRDFFILFPHLCLVTWRVNLSYFGLMLFFVVSLGRPFITYNSISRCFSCGPYSRFLIQTICFSLLKHTNKDLFSSLPGSFLSNLVLKGCGSFPGSNILMVMPSRGRGSASTSIMVSFRR